MIKLDIKKHDSSAEHKAPKERKNSAETIAKVVAAAREIVAETDAAAAHVHISAGNVKLGETPSVSPPPVLTCVNCACASYCYAVRMAYRNGYKGAVQTAWAENLAIFDADPNRFFSEIANYLLSGSAFFFRWNVSGDIVNEDFFSGVVAVAEATPFVSHMIFTKNYSAVNSYLASGADLPRNLHVIFSATPGVEMVNPYSVAECHINFSDAEKNTFRGCTGKVFRCGGDCAACQRSGSGCWNVSRGDAVIINQH